MSTLARRLRTVGLIALPLVTLSAIAAVLRPDIERLTSPPPPEPPPPRLKIAGEFLGEGGDPVADALDMVRRFAQLPIVLTMPDGGRHELSAGSLGAEIDRLRLGEVVQIALDPQHPIGRSYREQRARDPESVVDLPVPLRLSTERAVETLASLKEGLDQAPVDAMVDLEKRELRPERIGVRLDVYGTLAKLDAALRDGRREVEADVEVIQPRVSSAKLGNVKFDQVLGWFETRYAQDAKHAARTYNLRQAATHLDGTVLAPGEEFEFNGTVGPRDEANGYKVAPVIAEGELVDGIGGGTCQISGTLHGAAFFAGLDIVSRTPHTRPSSYIKLGLDAAVAYPTIDFKLRNNFDEPIVLHETVRSGVVRAEILGSKRKRTVSFFRRIDEVTAFEETERETDKLPKGTRVLSQRGVPGFKTTVVRIVRDGAYAVRTKFRNVYPPTAQIVRVGTGDSEGDAKPPKSDRSPEYRADEYLVLTQGPDIRTPGVGGPEPAGGMVEARTPGRYGDPGWQAKLGMKVFDAAGDASEKSEDGEDSEGAKARGSQIDKDSKEGEAGAQKRKAKRGADKQKPREKPRTKKGKRDARR